ncbi:MAG: hypothetical protein LAT51_10415 [Flavobacteriaceae bacterium]|nr:hypothetical protein [Flavobacteriaceae bacterium]
MKLDKLYSLRRDFTIIGVTGRIGSGCSDVSKLLSKDFNDLEKSGLRSITDIKPESTFSKKYKITRDFLKYQNNWVKFDVIEYKKVLLFYIINKHKGGKGFKLKALFSKYFKEKIDEDNSGFIDDLLNELNLIFENNLRLITRVDSFKSFKELKDKNKLKELNKIFFEPAFNNFSSQIIQTLDKFGYIRRLKLLHNVACNIRSTGNPIEENENTKSIDHIYSIAYLINRIIKARKQNNDHYKKPTKIVIDSLRNSLEMMFFKERYSAFYMIACKAPFSDQITDKIKSKLAENQKINNKNIDNIAIKVKKLDSIEYKTNDFSKGNFYAPDVENCIQKSDYHLINLEVKDINTYLALSNVLVKNQFLTREEQLLKLIALILKPGLITPSPTERTMQIAHTAKLNSGCISRNVGAVITDKNYHIRSIGWNDVPKGQTPCSLRDARDLINKKNDKNNHYSDFEKGVIGDNTSFKYKNKQKSKFPEILEDYLGKGLNKNKNDLNGKNCAFCFKTIHNHYEGEANQVHTKSLHAEENAMLQITKIGGNGVENGILFTTASPCELCSKKAYQLGLRNVFYIDPYPGISNDQIFKGGINKNQPIMLPFSGAIGNSFQKLYDSFMPYKDEVNMSLEVESNNKLGIQFQYMLEKMGTEKTKKFIKENGNIDDQLMKKVIEKGLENLGNKK